MNLHQYLQRIQYSGERAPALDILNALQKSHLMNIPFENLDIHYGNKIRLDTLKIFQKVVKQGRGGFCYELNGLFYELLIALGFQVKIISARVFNKERKIFGAEFDHLALVTTIESVDYLTDAGFGEFSFKPLKIDPGKIQEDERGVFKIEKYDDTHLAASKQTDGLWLPEYIFSLQQRQYHEFEEMCVFHQTSADSHFTLNKLCSIATEHGRVTLTGDKLKVTNGKISEEKKIESESEFTENLLKYFNIEIKANQRSSIS